MTDLTREQIEEVRRGFPHSEALSAICDMALRTLDAEARNRKLEIALRDCMGWLPTHRSAMAREEYENAHRLIATPPPDSEPRVPEAQYVGIATGAPGEGHCTLIRNYMELRSWVRSMFWSGPPEEEPEDVKEIVRSLIDPDYWVADVLWSFTTEGDGTVYVAKLARAIAQPEQQDAMLERRDAGDILREKLSDPEAMQRVTERAAERQDAMLGRRDALEVVDEVERYGHASHGDLQKFRANCNTLRYLLSRTSDEGTGVQRGCR